jgi:CheY-like chemotaxis protein
MSRFRDGPVPLSGHPDPAQPEPTRSVAYDGLPWAPRPPGGMPLATAAATVSLPRRSRSSLHPVLFSPFSPVAASDNAHQRILLADDQPDVLEALRLLLKPEGYAIDTAKSPAAVLKAIESRDYALALIDLNYARDTTSGQEGLDLLKSIQGLDPTLPVLVMTAWASVEIAVEAMRRGARDFVTKPWDNNRLLATVQTHIECCTAVRA